MRRVRAWLRRSVVSGQGMAAWLMLGAGLSMTAYVSLGVKADIEQEARHEFVVECNAVASRIEDRLDVHKQVLLGGTALFAASTSVERDEWHSFVRRMQEDSHFRGIQGLGFALQVPRTRLTSHVAEMRRQGFPDYRVWPEGERDFYSAIVYIEPFGESNRRAFGYDMYTEPVRRAAMQRARDLDAVTLSGKVRLVQESGSEIQAGTLMYLPVYRNGAATDSVVQRRAALLGWVYSPFRMRDLLQPVLQDNVPPGRRRLHLRVYDGVASTPDSLLFSSVSSGVGGHVDRFFEFERQLDIFGRIWTLHFDAIDDGVPRIDYRKAWLVCAGGVTVSLLLWLLALSLLNTRRNALRIADELTAELRRNAEVERAMNQRLELQGSALDASANAIAILDAEACVVWANAAYSRMSGEPSGGGGNLLTRLIPVENSVVGSRIWQALRAGKTWHGELRERNAADGERDVEMTLSPVVDAQGKVAHFIAVIQDITDRKRGEELRLERAEEQRNALVREVHHRIKNNLQGMVGLLGLQAAQNPDAAAAIGNVIGKIKSIAVVFGLQGKHDENDVGVHEVVVELVAAARAVSNAEIVLAAEKAGADVVLLDKDKAVAVALIINELLTNAVKHNGGDPIRVELRREAQGAVLTIVNVWRNAPDALDWSRGLGLGTGLELVRVMLPREGARLTLTPVNGSMIAELLLSPPVTLLRSEEQG